MTKFRDRALSTVALVLVPPLALTAMAASSWAAEATAAATSDEADAPADAAASEQMGEIVVTARKRSENVLKVPVAVTAFSSEGIAARGITTMADIAAFTPSLTNNNSASGGARVDRSNQLLIIRGMNPSSNLNPTTSLFINGTAVGASNFLQYIDDVERIEVLKGPQAAYFGRGTFAGAINAIPKSPGDEFTGDFSAAAATRNTYRASGSVTVPVAKDGSFSFRIGGFYDQRDGSYKNNYKPSETLGDQKTYGAHFAVKIQPADNFTVKAYAMGFRNEDGPAATGLLLANGPAAFNQSNCTINKVRFFCGTLPSLSASSPAQITNLTAAQKAFFQNPGGLISKKDIVKDFGLDRTGKHVDASVEWTIPDTGLTVSYLVAANNNQYSSISDLANINGLADGQYPGYTGFPFLVETVDRDYSHELRVASDAEKRLRVLFGASYVYVYRESINYSLGAAKINPAPLGAPTESRTKGLFGSIAFDITDKLTLNAEGRYQEDTQVSQNPARIVLAKGTSKDFLPRISLQYQFTPLMMVYATYSKGINPGVFNTLYNAIPVVSQQALVKAGVAGTLEVKPERITNYEVGFKGRLFDGRATISLTAYYDKWTDQLNPNVYNFTPTDPANPYNVVGYNQYNPANVSQFPYLYTDNSAASTAKGIELEANFMPIDHVTINVTGAINEIEYDKYNCTSCLPYPTLAPGFNAAGKKLANSPTYSGSVGIQYQHETSLLGATGWFARVDDIYHSGMYIQASNTVKTPTSNVVNIRSGLEWDKLTLEGFVTNLFSERAYTSGFQNSNFAGGFAPAVMVGLPALITGGVRVNVKF